MPRETREMSRRSSDTRGGSPERFGFEWAKYSEIKPEYEEQFNRWLPFLTKEEWRGKRFLDVGCGMGRNSYWPMPFRKSVRITVTNEGRRRVIGGREPRQAALRIGHMGALRIAPQI